MRVARQLTVCQFPYPLSLPLRTHQLTVVASAHPATLPLVDSLDLARPGAGQYGTYTQAWVQAGILALAVVMFIAVDRIHAGNRKPSAGAEKSKSKVVG